MNHKLKNSILQKIEKESIEPRSKSSFMVQEFLFWFLYLAGIVFGAFGVAVIWYTFRTDDFDLLSEFSGSGVSVFVSLLPVFWILFFALFILLALFGVQHTRKGYKWTLVQLLGANVLLGIIFGSILYGIGQGRKLDEVFDRSVPGYESFHQRQMERWFAPEEGRLLGNIVEVDEMVNVFVLEEPDGTKWNVDYLDSDIRLEAGKPEFVPVRVVGAITDKGHFVADVVAPLRRFEPNRIRHKLDSGAISRNELEVFRAEIFERLQGLPPQERQEARRALREKFRQQFGD